MRVRITPASLRAFIGRPVSLTRRPSDLETAGLGESIAMAYLRRQVPRVVKAGSGHFPFDVLAPPWAVEVKAGLVSNQPGAEVWRLTIGEPSADEKLWLRSAHADDKRMWNAEKQRLIHERKEAARERVAAEIGEPLTAVTVGVILDTDRQLADVHEFQGWIDRIPWTSAMATRGYRGSFAYEIRGA